MTVTLEIPPDMEAQLSERAALIGQALPDYLLSLAEADLYDEQTDEDREEEASILHERIHDRLSGDKGILLEDYWAGVSAKRESRARQQAPEKAA